MDRVKDDQELPSESYAHIRISEYTAPDGVRKGGYNFSRGSVLRHCLAQRQTPNISSIYSHDGAAAYVERRHRAGPH